MKTIEAVTKTYKGILIFETMSGFLIFGEGNKQFVFDTEPEAEAFVDAWFANLRVSV